MISGSQEVRVNAELRILTIAGIVRPLDIGPQNTISYERIAEARISYGGRGRLTEVQQPPYGQQILDQVLALLMAAAAKTVQQCGDAAAGQGWRVAGRRSSACWSR